MLLWGNMCSSEVFPSRERVGERVYVESVQPLPSPQRRGVFGNPQVILRAFSIILRFA